jgi:hypothetical protein
MSKETVVSFLPAELRGVLDPSTRAAIMAGRRVLQIISYYPDSLSTPWPSARLVRQVERAIATGDYDRFAKKHGLKRR